MRSGKNVFLSKRNLANREQTSLVIDLDDIASVDPELADAIHDNTRRYSQIFAQVVQEMLPELKDREVRLDDDAEEGESRTSVSFRFKTKMCSMFTSNIER